MSKQATCGRSGSIAGDDADGGEVVRLVQRRQRLERGQPGEDGGVEQHRAVEVGAAVDDAVADGAELDAAEAGEPAAESPRWRRAGRGARRRSQRPVDEGRAVGVGGAQARADADAVDLAADLALEARGSAAKSWNFRLDEPALTTRIASMRQTAGTGAVRRSALA